MANLYTKAVFIDRVRKHIANGFPNENFPVTDNEVLLYIDTAIPFILKSQVVENAKIVGVMEVPSAYLVTYNITPLSKNTATGEWYGTLPQTPLALPDGFNITDMYFTSTELGQSKSLYFVSSRRNAFRDDLPAPNGVLARFQGNLIYMKGNSGQSLAGLNLFVQMPISRTSDTADVMSIPDDAIEPLFKNVVGNILQRYGIPYDQLKDDLPSGNKAS